MSVSESALLTFRRLSERWLEEIMDIEIEAYPEPWTEGMFRDELRNPRAHFFVVLRAGTLVGYGGFWLIADEAHVTSLTVRDSERGRSYGTRILEYLLAAAVDKGARMATLEVRPTNIPARELYRKFGFRAVGIRKNYYTKTKEDAIIMLKKFPQSPAPHHEQ